MADNAARKVNPCPKADRCIYAAECICYDTFRGEYLCFDSGAYSDYNARKRRYNGKRGKRKK